MSRWVAIDVAIGDNPKVWRFAGALFGPIRGKMADLILPAAAGHITMLLGSIKIHAPSGDVSDVPDELIELWAKWRGTRGLFASTWRKEFAPDGMVNDWEEWNGRLVRQQEAERKRWHQRKLRGDSGGDSGGGTAETHAAPTYLPTNQPKEKTSAADASVAEPSKKPKRKRATKPKPAHTGEAASRDSWLTPAGTAWEETFGAGSFDYGRAAKKLSSVYRAGIGPEEIGRRLREYVRQRKGKYCKLDDFAEHHGEYVPVDRGPALLDGGVLSAYGEELTRPDGMPAPKGWYS